MDPRIPESASVAMFSEAHNFSLHGPDFRAAGRDMHVQTCNSTFNLNIDTGPFHSSISETSSSSSQKLFTFEGLMSRIMASFVDESLRGQDPGHPHSAGTASTPETASSPKAKAQVHHEGDVAVIVLEKPEEKFTLIGDLTTPEIYVSNMLGTGKGLACWQPRPRKPYAGETGAIPGDVGTYSAEGGFKKIFNLWDDEVALANKANELYKTTYRAPERNVFIDESEMQQDETIVSGASSDILYMNDGRTPVGFEFRCRSQHGAIAIPTSSAELEEVVDCMALRDTIIQNNALFYQYANGIRTIGDEEALYILTGCIKSESWALAAYREPMSPPHDLLRLIKGIDSPGHGSSHSSPSQYTWTNRGTSAARLGGSEVADIKDQSLFLRGFKLDFSQKFRTQMKSQPWKLPVTTSPIGGAQGGSSFKTSLDSSNSRQRNCHPCDSINNYLLKMTGADVALSHDDDWRFALKGVFSHTGGVKEAQILQIVSIRHGVAYLSRAPDAQLPTTPGTCTTFSSTENEKIIAGKGSCGSNDPVSVWTEKRSEVAASLPGNGIKPSDSPHVNESPMDVPFNPTMGHPSDFHSLQLPTLNPHLTSCASPSYRRSFHPSCNNPVPCAFIDDGLPHHSGCPRLNTYHSYPPSDIDTSAGIERISFSGEQIEENLGNQALSAPGDFLRQKLGLKPGEPVNLWSLPDPEPDKRPPHSYPLLVRLAIYGSPNQRMTLKQIYEAIEERFEFYRKQPKGAWRGSIRHNLSLNQVFKNVHHDRPLTEPGNYGEIDHSVGEEYKCERKDDQSWNRNPVRRLERL